MIWQGKQLKVIGDYLDVIKSCKTKEQAREFIKEYVLQDYHARANIGYLIGYFSREDQSRLYDWFDVVHPLFGSGQLPPEEIYNIGYKTGERIRNGQAGGSPWFVGALERLVPREESE